MKQSAYLEAVDSDEAARRLGWNDSADMRRTVADADISTPEKVAALQRWQADDASKAGFSAL